MLTDQAQLDRLRRNGVRWRRCGRRDVQRGVEERRSVVPERVKTARQFEAYAASNHDYMCNAWPRGLIVRLFQSARQAFPRVSDKEGCCRAGAESRRLVG